MNERDVQRVIHEVLRIPGIAIPQQELPDLLYGHLSQCILAAVYSLNAYATIERNVVNHYTSYARLRPKYRPGRHDYLPLQDQEPIESFLRRIDDVGVGVFAASIIRNQRPAQAKRGAISRAEAAYFFACILRDYGVRYLEDVLALEGNPSFERAIESIPGQNIDTSLNYFLILTGSETRVKRDQWIVQFLTRALGRAPRRGEEQTLLTEASYFLAPQYPHLTPRMLDTRIWVTEQKCEVP